MWSFAKRNEVNLVKVSYIHPKEEVKHSIPIPIEVDENGTITGSSPITDDCDDEVFDREYPEGGLDIFTDVLYYITPQKCKACEDVVYILYAHQTREELVCCMCIEK